VNDESAPDAIARSTLRIVPLFVAHVVGTANITLVVALSPAIEASLGLNHAGFGLMVSAFYGGMLLWVLPAGWMVDRFGLRAMLVMAFGLVAAGVAILARSSDLFTGGLALFLCGTGYAFINPATARAVLMWFSRRSRATVMGIKQCGVPAGGVIAAAVVAANLADWRTLTMAMGIATLAIGMCYLALRVAPQSEAVRVRLADIVALFRLPRLALFNAASCLYAVGQAGFFAYLVLYARDGLGVTLAMASLCLAIAHVASAIGRIVWGIVSDRMVRDGRLACLVAIGVLAFLSVLMLQNASALGTAGLVVAAALVGFTMGGYAGLTQAATVEAVEPQHAGAAIGYNLLLLSLGTMIGPAAFGFAVQAMDYGTAWTALAVLVLAGAALYHASAVVARR